MRSTSAAARDLHPGILLRHFELGARESCGCHQEIKACIIFSPTERIDVLFRERSQFHDTLFQKPIEKGILLEGS
jgi:hypothetical protein